MDEGDKCIEGLKGIMHSPATATKVAGKIRVRYSSIECIFLFLEAFKEQVRFLKD
jgi:hypothetical protein